MGADDFGEPIFRYSRKQALEDGWLIDVTDVAREAGISYPVAVTRRVWDELIVPDEASRQAGQDERGRLWDVLFLLRAAILRGGDVTEIQYLASFAFQGSTRREVPLKAVCGPDDDHEPCITIMRPDED